MSRQIFGKIFGTRKPQALLKVVETEEDLWKYLEQEGFTKTDFGNDLSNKAKSYVCGYVNYAVKDVFGDLHGEVGFNMIKRRYVFKQAGIGLFFLHVLQVTICLFVVLTRFHFYNLFGLIAAGIYLFTKIVQGAKIVYSCTFESSLLAAEQFLGHFPAFRGLGALVRLSFMTMGLGVSCSSAVADSTPSLTYHGMFNLGTSALIAYCGIASGIMAESSFGAISAFVAFRFIGDFDDVFIQRMTVDTTVEELVQDLKPENTPLHYQIYIAGYCYCGIVGCSLMLYPLFLQLLGVI